MRKIPQVKRPLGYLPRTVDVELRRDFQTLLEKKVSVDATFKEKYLLQEIFSKFVGHDTDSAADRKQRAVDKWLSVELRNSKTNSRLYFDEANFGRFTSTDILEFARKAISKLLGNVTPESVLFGTFSNGASTSKRAGWANVARKFAERPDVTESCYKVILPMLEECMTWKALNSTLVEPRIVESNIMFTVPKSTTIDRVAAMEPDLNMFAQKGIGNYIRNRLRSKGINLNDQTLNQKLAKEGSRKRNLATIDLSSASDSVSTSLVCLLLPTDWFYVLNALRSQRTQLLDGSMHENEMFSSMGNGFTFELESMIFWSLTRAIAYYTRTRGVISVYGDDIICPTPMAALLPKVFHFFGFTVNTKKSHISGGFRESCGKHYHNGYDVSPFYVKEPIHDQERLIRFLNRLRKWAEIGTTGICDPDYFSFWKKWSRFVDHRFYGGYDVERIDALVSSHSPNKTLTRKSKKIVGGDLIQTGAYLHWLRATHDRVSDSLETVTSSITISSHEYTIRRLKPCVFGTRIPLFPEELP